MTVIALVILAVLLPPVIFDMVRRPTIRRLGLRNVSRRRGEAALVVGGSLLATALVTAAFVVGDSFGGSIRNLAEDLWGPTDMIVDADHADQAAATQAVTDLNSANIDGVLPASFISVAMGAGVEADDTRHVEPRVRLLELDPVAGSNFGGDPSATGLADITAPLADDEIILNDVVAEKLGAEVGDPIDIFIGPAEKQFEVVAILERTGMAGIGEGIVAPGVVTEPLFAVSAGAAASVVRSGVFVSNTGDVFAGAELSDTVNGELEDALSAAGIENTEISPIKQFVIEDAEAESADTTNLFGTIGGFSVAAGILLVINLFVMLAAERTVELGTMRAVGMRRGSILRAFALEGAVYGLVAAAIGALVGVAVGAAVTAYASTVLPSDSVGIDLFVEPRSVLSGAAIGFAISQLTVVLTSVRTTKLNIIRALKDLPAQGQRDRTWKSLVVGLVGVVGAIALYVVAGTTPIVAMVAPVAGLVAAIPLASRVIPARIGVLVFCGAGLFWAAAVFGLLPEVMDDPDISLFLAQGVLLVGLAVTMAAVLDSLWSRVARLGGGANVAARVGLAHPLDRPVRSALLVAMYALVIFTVTFMGVMNSVFSASTPELARQATGNWQVLVDTNEVSTYSVDDLAARSDVAAVAPIRVTGVEVAGTTAALDDGDEPQEVGETYFTRAQFVDAQFLAASPPALTMRDDAFATDAAAWAAIAEGNASDATAWVVVQDWSGEVPGDVITLRSFDGADVDVTVAGVMANGWLVGSGMYLSEGLATTLKDDPNPPWRHFLVPAEGTTATDLAAALNVDGVEKGVSSTSVLDLAISETGEQEAFISILQGYLGLGLLIGIAGLGVVLVRAVRERRRQLGMMRAIGIGAETVRGSFLMEAVFIGFQGVALGIGLGVLSSWQTLTRSTAFEEGLTFALPYAWLAGLAAAAVIASALAGLIPAVRAGRVPPASALRITG